MVTKRKPGRRKKVAKKQAAKKPPTRKKAKTPAKVAKVAKAAKPGRRKKVAKKQAAKKPPTRKKAKTPAKSRKKQRETTGHRETPASSEPVELTRKAEWSISQFRLNTGFARETIRTRFAETGLKPARKVRGYPVYLVSDALPILYYNQDGEGDPDKMKPFDRRAFYAGELDKLKLEVERGELVPSFEVEREISRLFKLITHWLDTLPDVIERDVGATGPQLARIEKALDEARESLYQEVVGDDDARSTAEASA